MNKKFILLIPIAIVIALLLTFCGKTKAPEATDVTVYPIETEVSSTEIVGDASEETLSIDTTEVANPTEETESQETESQETEPQKEVIHTGGSTGEEDINEGSNYTPPTSSENDQEHPTQPENPETPQEPALPQSCGCEYDRYLSMSAADQQAYMSSFSSMEDFISWSKSAAAAHDGHNSGVTVEGGNLDLGDFIG